MSELDAFRATFFDECAELLTELEEQFAEIAAGDAQPDRLNAVFRSIHSIKGGGGAFGFTALVEFTHAYETLLDCVRSGELALSPAVVQLCLRANDIVADFIAAARGGEALLPGYGDPERLQFEALCAGGGIADDAPMTDFDIDFVPVRAPIGLEADLFEIPPLQQPSRWRIRFVPTRDLFARANDPLLLLRELAALGALEVVAEILPIPPLADFEPLGVYCGWDLVLDAAGVSALQIAEVFEFVEGYCQLDIAPMEASEEALGALDEPSFASLAETLARPDAVKRPSQTEEPDTAATSPQGLVENLAERRTADDRRNGVQSIRVDLDKVDRVVNMVGELVITQSMLTQQLDETLRARYQELVRGLEVLAQTTRGLQDAVMAIRAQPVKTVFSRMPRLVRELAGKTGKQIRLETVGEATEIDKTIIEQLSDPLTHMIRNSADHGIELPAARAAAGKPAAGTIRLSAEQAGGSILIAVEDDGAGINRERVLRVAQERGVVGPDVILSEEQIDQLIFAPGFSTAEAVSDISGRGVGMDVVLSNIKKIGGSVQVRSWPGRGTRMTLKLPLTLAVLDVMLVKLGSYPYVIPLSSIIETIQSARASFSRLPTGAQVLQVRGEYVQVIDLAERFGMRSDVPQADRFVVLCEAEGGVRVAVVVDDIIGQQQVVIKSLEENFESIEGVAGGTILGDGNVALIVDIQGLRAIAPQRNAA